MRQPTRLTRAVLAAGLQLTATGCAGASTTLVATDAHYPVSLTRGVRDADGELVPIERRRVMGRFEMSTTAWALVYSAGDLTPSTDLSTAINEQVAARGGDAIINLRVASAHCALDWFFPLTILPVWPGCTLVRVEGDIVRVLPAQAAAARVSPPGGGAP